MDHADPPISFAGVPLLAPLSPRAPRASRRHSAERAAAVGLAAIIAHTTPIPQSVPTTVPVTAPPTSVDAVVPSQSAAADFRTFTFQGMATGGVLEGTMYARSVSSIVA